MIQPFNRPCTHKVCRQVFELCHLCCSCLINSIYVTNNKVKKYSAIAMTPMCTPAVTFWFHIDVKLTFSADATVLFSYHQCVMCLSALIPFTYSASVLMHSGQSYRLMRPLVCIRSTSELRGCCSAAECCSE